MYGCETIHGCETCILDHELSAKELMLLNCGVGKTFESLWDRKKIKPLNTKENQPWIFPGRADAEAEAPILWPPDVNSQLFEKTLMLGKMEGQRRRGQQRMRQLDSITDSKDTNLSKLWEMVEDTGAWFTTVHGVAKSQTWLSDWTITRVKRSEPGVEE